MKPNLCDLDTMMFFDAALESQRGQLLTELADAVSETRTTADQAAELNEDGEAGLLRLTEICCAMNGVPAVMLFEGRQVELLAKKYENRYPLIEDWHWSRDDCIRVIEEENLPLPGKSSCFFCPSMKGHEIEALKRQHPDLYQRAIAIEENAMPNLTKVKGLGRSYVDENRFEWRLEVEEDLTAVKQAEKSRRTEEVEAESISYAVCQYFGIETGENSFGYIAHWSQGKDLKELRASLETINKTSGELISNIERHYKELCKERGIDLTAAPEPERDPVEQLVPEAEPEPLTEPDPNLVKMADEAMAAGVDTTWTPGEEFPLFFDTGSAQPSAEFQEALLVLDDTTYLHIQPCDTGWDYTLYDKETMRELDGGQLDAPDMNRLEAIGHICEDLDLGSQSMKYAPLSMVETLQEAAYRQMQEQAVQQAQENTAGSAQLPDAQEQALDEYPMPDPALTQDDLEKCGYLDSDLLPLSKERAYELMERDLTVYIVQEGATPEMAFDTADLDAHDGIFAVSREEWEESPAFETLVQDRMNHQQEREQAFLSHKGDCFAIYQVKHTEELRDIRYEGLDWLKSIGKKVQRENYELAYTAPLLPADLKGDTAEQLFYRFNNEHPADYQHPSMSVSDIVAIKRDGQVSCHYCDSFGFEQVPGFLPDNPLKNAEMAVEDDYSMIDGIINNGSKEPTVAQLEQQARSGQPISLMDLAAAAHREDRDKKKSVVEQLKSQPRAEHKKAAPKKSAEREI